MSPEAQRRAIAEACGGSLPNYLNDLNAMQAAWRDVLIPKTANPEDWRRTESAEEWLIDKLGAHGAIHATASERAEAFLRALELWDDSK